MEKKCLFALANAVEQCPSEFLRDVIRTEARKKKLWNPENGEIKTAKKNGTVKQ
jgi:hypothetical protein